MYAKAIDKIKKCLELSNSSNPHEAQVALERAKKLMAKYGINDKDVYISGVFEANTQELVPSKIPTYMSRLAQRLCNHYGLRVLHSPDKIGDKKVWRFSFYGQKDKAEMAAYAYDVVIRLAEQSRRLYMATLPNYLYKAEKNKRGDSFILGWIQQATDNISNEEIDNEVQKKIEAYFDKNFGKLSKRKSHTRKGANHDRDFKQGVKSSEGFNLNKPVNGESQRRLH